MKILESAENYLETILVLKREKSDVRAIDIVNHLGFSKPSVSIALKHLEADNLIARDPSGYISLTEDGLKIAEDIYERHAFLSAFFQTIGVSEETAIEDACKVEHYLSDETFQCLKETFK